MVSALFQPSGASSPSRFILITAHSLAPGLRGRPSLTATLVSKVLLALLLIPTAMLAKLLVQNTASLVINVRQGQFVTPPPPDTVQHWPLIGEPISRLWFLRRWR
jgi:hypothetical protein